MAIYLLWFTITNTITVGLLNIGIFRINLVKITNYVLYNLI